MNAHVANHNELRELYRELILDHARSPRHFGKLQCPTHVAEGLNPLCGDRLTVELAIGKDDRIADAAFNGSGCAISVASASIMTETIIGLLRSEATGRQQSIVALLRGELEPAEDIQLARIRALAGVREFPARIKCATLAWQALRSAIDEDGTRATTE